MHIYIETVWMPPLAKRHSVYPVGDFCSPLLSHALTDLQTQKHTHISPVAGPDLWSYLHLTLRPLIFQVAGLDLLVPHEANTQTPRCLQVPIPNLWPLQHLAPEPLILLPTSGCPAKCPVVSLAQSQYSSLHLALSSTTVTPPLHLCGV